MEAPAQPVEPRRKRTLVWALSGALVLVLVLAGSGLWYTQVKVPHDDAVAAYDQAFVAYAEAADSLSTRNTELDTATSALETLADSGQKPLDPEVLSAAQVTLHTAKTSRDELPKAPSLPDATEDIEEATKELPAQVENLQKLGQYDTLIADITAASEALQKSIAQLVQVTNPSEEFVITRIAKVPHVSELKAVTEDNDPNGKLNKAGGYTSTVYIASTQVNQADAYGSNLIDKGTNAGGAIEVYRTVEEAEKRNTYLATFDGSVVAAGSHAVVGTVVIRTSDMLTASQQRDFEAALRKALITLP